MRILVFSLLLLLSTPPRVGAASTLHDPLWRLVYVNFASREGAADRYLVSRRMRPARANLLVATLVFHGPHTPFWHSFPQAWGLAYFTWVHPVASPPSKTPATVPRVVPLPGAASLLLGGLAALRLTATRRWRSMPRPTHLR